MLLIYCYFCAHIRLTGLSNLWDEVKDETPFRQSLAQVLTQMLEVYVCYQLRISNAQHVFKWIHHSLVTFHVSAD